MTASNSKITHGNVNRPLWSPPTHPSMQGCTCQTADDGCDIDGYGSRLEGVIWEEGHKYFVLVLPYSAEL
jgi:hypothetical protein